MRRRSLGLRIKPGSCAARFLPGKTKTKGRWDGARQRRRPVGARRLGVERRARLRGWARPVGPGGLGSARALRFALVFAARAVRRRAVCSARICARRTAPCPSPRFWPALCMSSTGRVRRRKGRKRAALDFYSILFFPFLFAAPGLGSDARLFLAPGANRTAVCQ